MKLELKKTIKNVIKIFYSINSSFFIVLNKIIIRIAVEKINFHLVQFKLKMK